MWEVTTLFLCSGSNKRQLHSRRSSGCEFDRPCRECLQFRAIPSESNDCETDLDFDALESGYVQTSISVLKQQQDCYAGSK